MSKESAAEEITKKQEVSDRNPKADDPDHAGGAGGWTQYNTQWQQGKGGDRSSAHLQHGAGGKKGLCKCLII